MQNAPGKVNEGFMRRVPYRHRTRELLQHLRSFAGITGPALMVFAVPGDRFRAIITPGLRALPDEQVFTARLRWQRVFQPIR